MHWLGCSNLKPTSIPFSINFQIQMGHFETNHNGIRPKAGKPYKMKVSFKREQQATEEGLHVKVTKLSARDCLARSRERKLLQVFETVKI